MGSFSHMIAYASAAADMSELNLAKGTSISFPDGKDKLLHFEIFLKPEEGIYK